MGVARRDLSKNERIQKPWTMGIVTQICMNCSSIDSIAVVSGSDIRAIEWQSVLCASQKAVFFYILRDTQTATILTILNSR